MRCKSFLFFGLILLLCMPLFAISTPVAVTTPINSVFQVATISSLARGVYDGDFVFSQLFTKGTQGVGTFVDLDGEMVAIDGQFYQIKASGQLNKVIPTAKVPFAEVVNFRAEQRLPIKNEPSYEKLMASLESHFKNKNKPYAIRIDGAFAQLRLRSLRKQNKPYPPLAQAAKEQAVFNLQNVKGSMVGFWFPKYWAGIAVPGFHLHFVTADRRMGGHVLGVNLQQAQLKLAEVSRFSIDLPGVQSFANANLDPAASHADIKAAEGGVK